MIKNLVIGVAVVMMLITGISFAAETDKEKAAVIAAEKWLALVDAGNFTESWQTAAEYFKGAITQETWIQRLQLVLKTFGPNTSRKLKSTNYKKTLPGAPDGEYVIIQYKSSFQNKKSAVETVTTMFDKDGSWRVVGHFIK